MRGEKDGDAGLFRDFSQGFKDHDSVVNVQKGSRFVQHEESAAHAETSRDGTFLKLSVTEAGYIPETKIREPKKAQGPCEFIVECHVVAAGPVALPVACSTYEFFYRETLYLGKSRSRWARQAVCIRPGRC